jgi:ABC-type Fe3+ transport system permease subunit
MTRVGDLPLLIGTITAWLVPRTKPLPKAVTRASRHSNLHHRLLLSRAVRLFRHAANRALPVVWLARPQDSCCRTAFAIVLAYTIRFLAATWVRLRLVLARSRDRRCGADAWRHHQRNLVARAPALLRPALGGATAFLAFVGSMRELPATLLLRSFNFDTLATEVFTLASLYHHGDCRR